MNLSPALDLIKEFEGLRLHAYQDSVGVWTIGWGTTGPQVTPGLTCSREQADQWLAARVSSDAIRVAHMVRVPANDNQLCALISFAYNLGIGALFHSHLLTYLNAGAPALRVGDEFLKWNHAGGRVLAGLTRRRKAERALFLS